jgi:hypothetical protein
MLNRVVYIYIYITTRVLKVKSMLIDLRGGADKSLALPISYFPTCSTTKRIFLGWVKEVRTTKS